MTDATTGERVLYVGGAVYSPSNPFATAMLVDGRHIAWVGEDSAADAYRDVADRVVHLDGALVTPGFVDAHVHATAAGLHLVGLDLRCAAGPNAILERVRAEARAHPGRAIIGHGWDDSGWAGPLTRAELDRAALGAPVYLTRVDGHSALVSTLALDHAPGVASADGFDPVGPVTAAAHHDVRTSVLGGLVPGVRHDAQRTLRAHAARAGIVCLHEMSGPVVSSASDLTSLLDIAATEPGPIVVAYWGRAAHDGGVDEARDLGAFGVGGDLFVDGSLGSRTAWLHEPYRDALHTSGSAYLDADQIAEHLIAATRAGLPAGIHAIGDAACAAVAAGVQRAAQAVGVAALRAGGHRVEHALLIDPEAAATLAEHGIALCVAPSFEAAWGGSAGMYARRLGATRAAAVTPLAALAAAGAVLAFGSDAPTTCAGPWQAIRAAVHHHTRGARISARAAFNAHTRGGWRIIGEPGVGTITAGAPAHLAIWDVEETVVQVPDGRIAAWSTDPRAATPGLPSLDLDAALPICLRTLVHGQVVHDAGRLVDEAA